MKTQHMRSIIRAGGKNMMSSFGLLSFSQYIRLVLSGLRHPAGTGPREYARQQLQRAWAPVIAVVFHLFVVGCFMMAPPSGDVLPPDNSRAVTIPTDDTVPLDPKPEADIPDPQDTADIVPPDTPLQRDLPGGERIEQTDVPATGPDVGGDEGSPDADGKAGMEMPDQVRSMAVIKWRVGDGGAGTQVRSKNNIKNIIHGQKLDTRGIEAAVMRSLRWLKSTQKADGSWDGPPVAMTSLALLCFLAHGEVPGTEDFGDCVERAIKYLAANQDNWPKRYEWAMATYAMSEAYGMTRIPDLQTVAARGVDVLVKGQRSTGGWCYGLTPQDEADDTSVMGWCAQALQAAKLAKVQHSGLESSIRSSIRAFKANAAPTGGFGYRGPGEGGLTGTGVLSMQLLGAAREAEVRSGVAWLDRATFKWNDAWLSAPLYYWYYATQAKYHAGGETWDKWDRQFAGELVRNQVRTKGEGNEDMGFWELPKSGGKEVKDHSTGLVYNTTLCCLMLEVYYKFLPTYKPPEEVTAVEDDEDEGPLKIDISWPVTPRVSG